MWKESSLGYHWFWFRAVSDWSRKSQASFLTNHMQNQPQWWLGRSCFPALEVVFTTYTLKQLTQALIGSSWNCSFQLSVEKPKPIKSQRPITIKLCIVISQWGIKVITGNFLRRGKVRMTKSLMFSVLNLIGWEDSASILNQSRQNQSHLKLLSTLLKIVQIYHVLIGQRISLGFVLRQSLIVCCGSIEIVWNRDNK